MLNLFADKNVLSAGVKFHAQTGVPINNTSASIALAIVSAINLIFIETRIA